MLFQTQPLFLVCLSKMLTSLFKCFVRVCNVVYVKIFVMRCVGINEVFDLSHIDVFIKF